MFETGRICMKTAGREAGKYCVVVNKIDKEFVLITGPKIVTNVRRRKCNVKHLEPIPLKIAISKNASDEEIIKAFEKEGVYSKLKLKKPTAEEIKLAKEAEEKRKKKEEQKGTEEKTKEKKGKPEIEKRTAEKKPKKKTEQKKPKEKKAPKKSATKKLKK